MRGTKTILLVILLALSVSAFSQSADGGFTETSLTVKSVQMYPNPATDYLTIKLQSPHASSVKLALHSVIGNILNVEKEQVDDYEVRIRVKDLPAGYYFLSIKEEESALKATYKFLKR